GEHRRIPSELVMPEYRVDDLRWNAPEAEHVATDLGVTRSEELLLGDVHRNRAFFGIGRHGSDLVGRALLENERPDIAKECCGEGGVLLCRLDDLAGDTCNLERRRLNALEASNGHATRRSFRENERAKQIEADARRRGADVANDLSACKERRVDDAQHLRAES